MEGVASSSQSQKRLLGEWKEETPEWLAYVGERLLGGHGDRVLWVGRWLCGLQGTRHPGCAYAAPCCPVAAMAAPTAPTSTGRWSAGGRAHIRREARGAQVPAESGNAGRLGPVMGQALLMP